MKRALRWLLWKLSGRDYLVLHPDWAVLNRQSDHVLLGAKGSSQEGWLPVWYNYHTGPSWHLDYRVRGEEAGKLRYRLGVPGKGHFCEHVQRVRLPCQWQLVLDAEGLKGNGHPIPSRPGKIIPRDAPWLVGEFVFQSETGRRWRRRMGHRIQPDAGPPDAAYFQGLVYSDYEAQAAAFPKQVLDSIRPYRDLRGKLLDVGCATGLLVEEALRQGLDAEGIDVSPWAVEKANARTGGRCRVLDLDQASAGDFTSGYDVITLHSVLEHLADPARALQLLFDLSRESGVVYIQTLNADSLMHRLLLENWAGYSDCTHRSPWLTADWLAAAAAQTGFEVASLKRYGIWNDNVHDGVWKSFASLVQIHPASVLLEDQLGDFVEMILRRP